MAIMASSPAPDTSVLDPKAQEPVLEKEKADVNGHKSPKSESDKTPPPDKSDAPTPLVNGKSSSPSDAVTNGVATTNGADATKEKPPANADDKPTDDDASTKCEEKVTEKTEDIKTEQSEVKEESTQKAESASQETKTEDIQMTDATNANDTIASSTTTKEPVRDETAPKPASPPESKSPATKAPDVDAVMSDEKPSKDSAKASDSTVDAGPANTSQPDIESTSPVDTSIEVSMADAPPTAKISREREDDFGDEPAPKRAKTEPKEEDEPSATPTVGTPAPSGDGALGRLATLTQWEDADTTTKKITPHQRREMRKIIARVKKTKHGGHFRDSVPKLWPALGESYLARIERPMDLGEIDRNLRDPGAVYTTFGDVKQDLALIYENTMTFNGAAHEVTASAYYAIRAVWQESMLIPEEEPARPKSVAKPKPPREHRILPGSDAVAAVQRQSSGPASSPPPPREVQETKPRPPPAAPQDHNADRRSSTATEGDRPKRTVRAPKPKDIDYTTKPSRKKLKPELQFCDEVLVELMHPKNQLINSWFLDAVDAEGLNIPEYYSIIKKPMDLGKVSRLLNGGDIPSLKDFDRNVRLIFTNCYQFNGPPEQGNPVSMVAKQLEDLYNQQMKAKDAWLARYAKANAPPASASNASDDDDDDESEEEEASAPGPDLAKEIQELQAKLEEETRKLNRMFGSGSNQSLIDCQKVIVETVQGALYKAAQSQGEAKAKQEKSSKKSSKPSKSKPSGSVPNRKSTGNVPPPKKSSSSHTKKPAPKKSLSAADKDQIASAINDLEYPHLDRAIDIIKRDTGQNENNEGELELDIDQLSNEALLKLWELCKKVLPGFGKDSAVVTTKSPEVNRAVPAKQIPKNAAKPKKNKPMSAQEQEARIAQLTAISQLYKPGQEPTDDVAHATSPNQHDESSDDSDSEEE